jgi:D-alanyl-D-alanine carboxypeptidase
MNNAFPIASLTKMMVALITVEDVRAGKHKWTDTVSWTRDIAIGRKRHKRIIHTPVNSSLYDLFKSAMIASNNEASQQMAIYIGGGSLSAFMERMNRRALELGMNSTYYSNPTGLPASVSSMDNSSTPIDLLTLAIEMLKYPEILEVTGMGYADVYNGRQNQTIRNHNRLTIDYSGEVDGMKTGYTKRAGFCLVATSNKCDYRLISVSLGSNAPGTRNEIVKTLINQYYASQGMDKLGPYCYAPSNLASNENSATPADESDAEYIYQDKIVCKTHVVKSGQHLTMIADRYQCSVNEIKKWNKLRSTRVLAGQRLKIYVSEREKVLAVNDSSSESTENTVSEKVEPKTEVVANKSTKGDKKNKYVIHVVQPGDTLFSISRKYEGSTVQVLKQVNRISNIRNIKVGTRLKVPVNS